MNARITLEGARRITELLGESLAFDPIPQPEVTHLPPEAGMELFNLTVRLAEFDAKVAARRNAA